MNPRRRVVELLPGSIVRVPFARTGNSGHRISVTYEKRTSVHLVVLLYLSMCVCVYV